MSVEYDYYLILPGGRVDALSTDFLERRALAFQKRNQVLRDLLADGIFDSGGDIIGLYYKDATKIPPDIAPYLYHKVDDPDGVYRPKGTKTPANALRERFKIAHPSWIAYAFSLGPGPIDVGPAHNGRRRVIAPGFEVWGSKRILVMPRDGNDNIAWTPKPEDGCQTMLRSEYWKLREEQEAKQKSEGDIHE